MGSLAGPDLLVFFLYFVVVAVYGWWVYRRKGRRNADSKDYFLAEDSLTWWAIGASLIASNISAEQFIGMSGSGFSMGLAIATYEWMGGFSLLIVAVFFLPIYIRNKVYTMPQFLRRRYDGRVALIMSVFWLLLYVVVNLTSILYLGALALNSVSGVSITVAMLFLALFAVVITLGGMKVIGYTDVVQVFFLVLGGLVTTWLALQLVSQAFDTTGVGKGFALLQEHAADHLHMIFRKSDPYYMDLPGLSVLIGGMLVVNLQYFGCNQYITQRALGADLKTARNGLLFAGFLKLLLPLIVVLPGIAAYALHQQGLFQQEMMQGGELNPDRAYPTLLNLLPAGLKGLSFAALTAAIVASLAGKANSIATIFALDVYKPYFRKEASEKQLVWVGKLTIVLSVVLAIALAPHLGIDKKGGFQYIQEYTGFVSPGVFAMFLLGFLWKRTTANAALFAIVGGFLLSVLLKVLPQLMDLSFLYPIGFAVPNAEGVYEIPFIDRIGIVFVLCVLGMALISIRETRQGITPHGLEVDAAMFKVSRPFLVGSAVLVVLLTTLYAYFW